jgi:hypothetical protein
MGSSRSFWDGLPAGSRDQRCWVSGGLSTPSSVFFWPFVTLPASAADPWLRRRAFHRIKGDRHSETGVDGRDDPTMGRRESFTGTVLRKTGRHHRLKVFSPLDSKRESGAGFWFPTGLGVSQADEANRGRGVGGKGDLLWQKI